MWSAMLRTTRESYSHTRTPEPRSWIYHQLIQGPGQGFLTSLEHSVVIAHRLLFSRCYVWLVFNPMDYSLPGFSVHGIIQAKLLKWPAISSSRGLSQHGDWTHISCIAGRFFFFFNFTILYWFCHISPWICHRYICVPHPEPSSLLPPHTIPLGSPSAPASSIQYHALNLDWRFISYMILYMFQCRSPKSSHPLPLHLPQSPEDCSIHQCLFCCLIYRVIVTIFLNSIGHGSNLDQQING